VPKTFMVTVLQLHEKDSMLRFLLSDRTLELVLMSCGWSLQPHFKDSHNVRMCGSPKNFVSVCIF